MNFIKEALWSFFILLTHTPPPRAPTCTPESAYFPVIMCGILWFSAQHCTVYACHYLLIRPRAESPFPRRVRIHDNVGAVT